MEKWHALACGLQLMLFVLLVSVYILGAKPTLRQQSLSDQFERIIIRSSTHRTAERFRYWSDVQFR